MEDRCQINALLSVGFSRSEIAKELGFHRSSIGREIKRNAYAQSYQSKKAQEKAVERYKACRKPYKIGGELASLVETMLVVNELSPELLAGRLRLEGVASLSVQGVYNHVHRTKHLKKYLTNHGRRGAGRLIQRRRTKASFLSIKERPEVVESRSRLGDWERDGMYVANRDQLLVFTDRKSRFTLLDGIGKMNAKLVTERTLQTLARVPIKIETITNDNGSEFSDSKNVGVPVYHCTPYKPQERGTVENMIGRIRRKISRKTLLQDLTEAKLREIENKLNMTPRKCLNFRTPYEVLFNTQVALAI